MESENDERPSLFQRLGFTQRHHSRPKAGATVQGPQDQYLALPNPDERADLRSSQLNDSDDETSPTLTAQQRRPVRQAPQSPLSDVIAVRPIVRMAQNKKSATAHTKGVAKRTIKTKKIIFKWEKRHIRALYVIKKHLQADWDKSTEIFNELFRNDIVSYGFRDGYGRQGLSAQYAERLKESPRKAWQEVLHPDAKEEAAIEQLRSEAETIARELNRTSVHTSTRVAATATTTAATVKTTATARVLAPRPSPSTVRVLPLSPSIAASSPSLEDDNEIELEPALSLVVPDTAPMEVREVQLRRLPTSQGLLVDGQLVTQAPLNDPSGPVVLFERVNEAEAHPALPALFYRYYHDGSQGTNSSDGFISGLFTGSRAGFPPPPATPDQMLYHYVKAHINRNHIHSPFISVCITLNWVIRQALQAQSRDETNPRICVIDASIAGRNRKAFYPGPYHREIKKYRPYENGAQLYSGTYEFLIWGNIPKEAIICDFPLSHLREHVDGIPELSSMLGFDILSQHRRSFRNVILPQLQARNVQVKPSIIPAMASLATFLGIDATSPAAYISKVVADIIEGWGIRPSIDSWAAWYDKAKLFAIYLSTISMSGPFDQKETAEAFLAGARAGLGQYDWFRFPSKERTVNTRASRVGLGAVVGGIKPREFYQVLVDHGADLKASRQRDMVRSFRYRGES